MEEEREKGNLFFSICVSAKERERERERQTDRQTGVVFPSFVHSNEKQQHRHTEELFFPPL